ncbi:unnamed protein product [Rotaria magnacalcarata]|uniref:Uncharacterized protein n=3 Tax=Rotaria magnacalcarata TaxID=392030 RepID=A0A816US01_9BILA|nr:unnamed protein product [Rotaria magnacalcarata]
MGCSNARLLVQAPSATETGARTNNPVLSSTEGTSPANVHIDTTTRMHLTGVDLVVERNGSYTLLLTPKTHKQLMPFVLRKKRFRILVDKPRSEPTLNSNESIMEDNKELKLNSEKNKKSKQSQMNESIIASMEQVASDELNKAESRLIGGRSIDRGNPDDEDENIQSDDEGMIEEIVTTVEQDKDLECKVKKKVETKKTMSQHPDTHNTITKVVKTEVTEITRTITINDHHDLERAKRELGIDDVNKLLPSSKWAHQSNVTEIKQKQNEAVKEIVTSKDESLNNQMKQTQSDKKLILSESTIVGRGPVTETISSPKSEQKPKETKKKKKKSKFCSCTRSVADDEQDKQNISTISTVEKPKVSYETTPVVKSATDTQIQGQQLISSDIKQLIIDKKFLLIEYIHSKIFSPSKLFTSDEQDLKGRKISSRILDLLRYDRCSSWAQMFEQFNEEYTNYLPMDSIIHPMINTYESLFTTKQAHLLNTFSTIHHENDIGDIQENSDYVTIVEKYKHERDDQTNVGIIVQQSVDNIINTVEQLHETNQEEQVVEAINDDEQVKKEVDMTDDIQTSLPIYNEEQLVKMLADLSPHKPITLAEAIAYQYIDIEDPKLGLSNDIIQHIKHLFRPLSDQSVSNLIRVQRSGEYLTDINLAETNPFEKLNLTDPHVYQLQQSFEPTLDFNEKQFRSLTETILSNKEQYDQLQFDIARTSLPIYNAKDSSVNDFSQSDSGYSMTTATHESLASKIKIEFEPINQDIPEPLVRSDVNEDEKIDLDKATQEQLNKYELNHDLIQIIKSDYNVSDKTIGQAILSRELRLDSADPSDVSRLNSLGIHKEQARVLHAFFFPKQTRIIAYSPEPGRFVEAQTTYNPDYPGYKTDTTIIQIQEKQLSSDLLAKQRNIHDERTPPILLEQKQKQKQEPEIIIPLGPSETTSVIVPKENLSSTTSSSTATITKTPIKKRKSSGHGSFLTCFRSKKSKAGTEQQGQAIIQPTVVVCQTTSSEQIIKSTQEKSSIDYAVTPDGKRIYIDTFRDRPGLDMSYKPNDFENRFVLPIPKPASEYEPRSTPEVEPITLKSQVIEHEPIIHLEPRSPIIEPVDVQPEERNIIILPTKTDEMTSQKKRIHIDLQGAAVKLPDIELVQPGPLPTLSIGKENKGKKIKTKSTGGLCASCFGKKSKENKRQKETISETAQAPIEHKKIIEPEKKEDLPSTTIVATHTNESSALPSIVINEAILPRVNIDVFRDRNFEKGSENIPQAENRSEAAREKLLSKVEINNQSPSSAPLSSISTTTVELPSQSSAIKNISIFSNVNIDTFRDRTFQKASESLPQPTEHVETTNLNTTPQPQESHFEIPANVPPVQLPTTTIKTIGSSIKDASIFSHVNIDTFKERTLEKGSEIVHKPIEHVDATVASSHEESRAELPTNESVQLLAATMKTIGPSVKDASIFSHVNIDTFRERTFEKGSENVPKPIERTDLGDAKVTASRKESHYEIPTNEPVPSPVASVKTIAAATKDLSIFSQINIDTFRDRTFEKGSESLPKPTARTTVTDVKLSSSTVESHYELPKNEPLPTKTTNETVAIDASIFSKVNIDTFRERTFEKSPKNSSTPAVSSDMTIRATSSIEEPHYQLPSGEPVPLSSTPLEHEYSTVDRNTYDVPRTIELQQTASSIEGKSDVETINNARMISSTNDMQKSSGDFLSTKIGKEKVKTDEISPIITDVLPGDPKETKIQGASKTVKKPKQSKGKKSKTAKKSGLFSLFCHQSKKKSKIPALDLPPIEHNLTANTQINSLHHSDDDPLHIPSTSLPKLDIPLPAYNRPEFDMTTEQIKQTSEFNIPVINLATIPNLQLPEHNIQFIGSNSDQMKVPNVELPDIQFVSQEQIKEKIVIISTVEDPSSITTTSIAQTEKMAPTLSSIEHTTAITGKNLDQSFDVPVVIENKTYADLNSSLPSSEPTSTLSKSATIPVTIVHDLPTQKASEKILIETKSKPTKRSSTLSLCSCFSNKANIKKTKTPTLEAPKTNLPEINIPISSSNISSTLKTQGSLRAPSNDLPVIYLPSTSIEPISLSTVHVQDKKITVDQTEIIAPSYEIRKQEEIQVQLPIQSSPLEKQTEEIPEVKSDVSTNITKTQQVKEIKNVSTDAKKSPLFEIRAPAINIPELDLSGPPKMDAYLSFNKQEELESVSEPIQSRSDSGLEAIVSSHVHPSSTFGTVTTIGDVQQLPSISSGLGSEILDKTTIKSSTLSDIQVLQPAVELKDELKYDSAHKITMNDEIHSKLISRQDQLKACLESEISKVIIDYDPKADHKPLEKILTHGIDLIKDKKVTTYSELQHELTVEHKHDAFIVDPVVRSLYCTIEKQGLDNLDKPEFPLAIRDMVRLPATQTYDTVTHLNKGATPLATTQMINETQSPIVTISAPNAAAVTIETKLSEQKIKSTDNAARSCLTCGRSKSKPKVSSSSPTTATTIISSIGLLDERHRSQLNTHRHELGTIVNNHIQSSQPPIRSFSEHPKEIEKIIRKALTFVTQPKVHSYEQIRNDLKTEYKQTFYLVDPTVDIIRDTLNHCDITQMNEKINLDILNSNISQTVTLYNNQSSLLTNDEHNALKSNQLSWLQQYLINNELKEKKLTQKQNRELSKILHRTLEILSTNHISTWDELTLQLQREYPKAHDLCHRAVELVKQSQKNGLLLLQQAPNIEEKRRSSFLITDRARQNLKINRNKIILSLRNLLNNHNKLSNDDNQLDMYFNKSFDYLEEQKQGQFKTYDDLKQQLKQDFKKNNQENLIEQIVDVIEQAHTTNQFDDINKPEVQALLQERLNGKPLIIKEVYVSLPPRIIALKSSSEGSSRYISASANGDQPFNNTLSSHAVARGLSWREANERARILFYRGKHPAIHYDEQAAAFDVRMLLETASGGTQEIPVTDSDVHELLNSCGVQWDGVNIISLIDHSEDVVRAAEQAALKIIREKGIIDLRAPPSTNSIDIHDDDVDGSVVLPSDASTPSS